jgi:hypothetical protein
MDAILFSADPSRTELDDAVRHLAEQRELYWTVGFEIDRKQFAYPIEGYIHVKRGQVEYKASIGDIVPFSRKHYEDPALKPKVWRDEYKKNPHPGKYSFVITGITPFSYDTHSLKKIDGTPVRKPPENYVRIISPGSRQMPAKSPRVTLNEMNLEKFLVQQLEAVEPGLRLETEQLSTKAGRIDLLCRDKDGNYVVIEIKRQQGSDQVIGQIARYMGCLKETYPTKKVRGIVVVGKHDDALAYTAKAMPDVEVKEFRIQMKSVTGQLE